MFAITVFTRKSATVPMRRLFEYFHKVIKIHCNRCNAVLASNGNLFLAIVMLFIAKCVYLDALLFRSLLKIFAFFSSCVKAVNFASKTNPTSLFLSLTSLGCFLSFQRNKLFNKNRFMLSKPISNYECTREVWRVRKKRKSYALTSCSLLSALQISQVHHIARKTLAC